MQEEKEENNNSCKATDITNGTAMKAKTWPAWIGKYRKEIKVERYKEK